ncbi:MAG: AMP-binding protein [Bacteroidales bacterium]
MEHTERSTSDRIKNLPLLLASSEAKFSEKEALVMVNGPTYTYREMAGAVSRVARMLDAAGIGKEQRVAILSENSPHWGIAYFGILTAGATTVPILPDFQGPEIRSILEHSEARALFLSGKSLARLDITLPDHVELVIDLDDFQVLDMEKGAIRPTGKTPGVMEKLVVPDGETLDPEKLDQAGPHDLASIIYTSGTTGRSKGVMLSHDNIVSNATLVRSVHQVKSHDIFLSVLPLAHAYECTIGFMVPLLNGATVHYIDRAPTASYLGPLLQRIRPTTMLTVPLIIEKVYRAKIKPALNKNGVLRAAMKVKPSASSFRGQPAKNSRPFSAAGSAFRRRRRPLAPDVERFLIDGRFPCAIGYGLTETAPMISGFGPDAAVYRSVGTVMEGCVVRIDNPDPATGEGEIVVTGPNIMKGYYRDEERTREVFTEDGYFRTGDLGFRNEKGIIFIRGRIKNMILGPNGENIYPEEIEALINSKDLVNESLVMEVKGKLVARVNLKLEVLEERFQHMKDNVTDFQEHIQIKAQETLDELLIQVNQHVARSSRLQMMILQVQPFEKTPTQKIKRFIYAG